MYSPLSEAKHALENSLKNLKAQTEEIAENEKRLAAAKENESQLLSEKWDDEGMQIVKLGLACLRPSWPDDR